MNFDDYVCKCELLIKVGFKEYNSIWFSRYSGEEDYLDNFYIKEDVLSSLETMQDFLDLLEADKLYEYQYGEFVDLNSLLRSIHGKYGNNHEINKNDWFVDKNGYGIDGEKAAYYYKLYLRYLRYKEVFLKQLELLLQYTEISEIEISLWYLDNDYGKDQDYTIKLYGNQLSFLKQIADEENVFL